MVATFREGGLVAWAEASGQRRTSGRAGSGLRFAFYGRVSTEDWQREGPPHHARCLRVGFGAAGFAGARAGRWLLDLGTIATLAANVAHGLGHGISAHWWPRAQRLREYLAAAANTHGGSLTA